MKILAITNHFPLPQDMGGALRIFGLMRALADGHDLQVLALRRRDTSDALVAELGARVGAEVETFLPRKHHAGSTVSSVNRWIKASRRGMPPWVLQQFHPELCRRAIQLTPGVSAVVLLDDYAGVYASRLSRLAPVVADKHQVAGWSRPQLGPLRDRMAGAPADIVRDTLARRLTRRFERRVAREVTAMVVTSDEEAARFEEQYGQRPFTVPSAIELGPSFNCGKGGGRRIGWLGTHAYTPNAEGLVRFVDVAWDPMGSDGYELLVAGRNPTPVVGALERHEGVRMLGYVEDLSAFMAKLDAAVVPLWDGSAGAKLKTLTFMGAGIPLACTPVAVEALGAEHGRHCLIANDPQALAAALRSILDGSGLAARLSAGGRQLVRDNFTWETVAPRFVEIVERAALSANTGG